MNNKYIKIILSILFSVLFFSQTHLLKAQEYYYTSNGIIYLNEIATDRIIVKFKDNITTENKNEILHKTTKEVFRELKPLSNLKNTERTNLIKPEEERIYLQNSLSQDSLISIINNLRLNENIIYAAPIYKCEDGSAFYYTDEFIVKLKTSTSFAQLDFLARKYQVSVLKELEYFENIFLLRLDDKSQNLINISNIFHESGLFEFSEPNFKRIIKRKKSASPNSGL